ncbi:hypothetical protein DIPPA_58021 [Diplonema papillatum]|nr:hypothetical protein DIPPA_58021 [Diplonema papillatum]
MRTFSTILNEKWHFESTPTIDRLLDCCAKNAADSEQAFVGLQRDGRTALDCNQSCQELTQDDELLLVRLLESRAYHEELPAVRSQLMCSMTRQRKVKGDRQAFFTRVLLSGLADSWSATRKSTASCIANVLEQPFAELLTVIKSRLSADDWRLVDGAMLACLSIARATNCSLPLSIDVATDAVASREGTAEETRNQTQSPNQTSAVSHHCDPYALIKGSSEHADKNIESSACFFEAHILLLALRHLAHDQLSIKETSARFLVSLVDATCNPLSVTRFYRHLHRALQDGAEGALMVFQDIQARLPRDCVREGFRNVMQHLSSKFSVSRQLAASCLVRCMTSKDVDACRRRELTSSFLQHACQVLEAEHICLSEKRKPAAGQVRDGAIWQSQEGVLFAVEELLMNADISSTKLLLLASRISVLSDRFELVRMKSQTVPHLMRQCVALYICPASSVLNNSEMLFWYIWYSHQLGRAQLEKAALDSLGQILKSLNKCEVHRCGDCSYDVWGIASILAGVAYFGLEPSLVLMTLIQKVSETPRHLETFGKLLPAAVPHSTAYLPAVIDILARLLSRPSTDVASACNFLEALRRCSVLVSAAARRAAGKSSGASAVVIFDATPVVNGRYLTHSLEVVWGKPSHPSVTTTLSAATARMIAEDRSKLEQTIAETCCALLANSTTEPSVCRYALRVLADGKLTEHGTRLLSSLSERMVAAGYMCSSGSIVPVKQEEHADLHDWDLDSEEDECSKAPDGCDSGFISNWKADVAACLIEIQPTLPNEHTDLYSWISHSLQENTDRLVHT